MIKRRYVLLVFAPVLAGCKTNTTEAPPPIVPRLPPAGPESVEIGRLPSPPPPGSVHILGQLKEKSAHAAHWQWLVVGDRNWSSLSTDSTARIGSSYPLHDLHRSGGANVFVYDIRITTDGGWVTMGRTLTALLPAAGGKFTSGSKLSNGGAYGAVVTHGADQLGKPLLTGDHVLTLPVSASLLDLTLDDGRGGQRHETERLQISK